MKLLLLPILKLPKIITPLEDPVVVVGPCVVDGVGFFFEQNVCRIVRAIVFITFIVFMSSSYYCGLLVLFKSIFFAVSVNILDEKFYIIVT